MPGNWFIALRVPTAPWWPRVSMPPEGCRLFDPDDVHVTVAFLGPVTVSAAEAAFELAPQWPTGPLEVMLADVAPMGNPRRPSAFSALIDEGSQELSHAIGSVRNEMCRRAGAKTDDRPPLPHATIARPHRRTGREQHKAMLAWARTLDLGRPRVLLSRLTLYTRADRNPGQVQVFDVRDPSPDARLFRDHASCELGVTV